MKSVLRAWDEFWFADRDLKALALFRIFLTGTMALMYLDRQFDIEIFYSANAMLPRGLSLSVIPNYYRPVFEWFFWNDAQAGIFHGLLVLGLLSLCLGIGGRVLTALVWVLNIGFLHRNYSIAFGADVIGNIFLFYMIFTRACDQLSLWNWVRTRKWNREIELQDLCNSMFYRLIQVQLCVIYAYTGFEKLRGMSWWDGTALWTVLANPQMVVTDLTWMRNFPFVIVVLTYVTVLFEIYFTPLVWNPKTRRWILILGVFFHLGTAVMMGLWGFGLVMISTYFLFERPPNLVLRFGSTSEGPLKKFY